MSKNTDHGKSAEAGATNRLKLNTRGRYAVMSMVELARRGEAQPTPLADIARSGDVSLSYLEQLFAGLRRGGLVKSYRGPSGGYVLAASPDRILVSDILRYAEDSVPARRAANDGELSSFGNEPTQALWSQIGEILYACLSNVTLADVAEQKLGQNPAIDRLFAALRKP